MDLRRCIYFCMVVLCSVPVFGSDTMTGIFDEKIKSLQVRLDGNDFASPVAVLGSADRIRIDFDRIAEDRDFLRYSLVHCSARWQPSGLVDSEFLDGFNEGTIEDYDFSRATTVHYVHYSLTIPNEQVSPRLSGNYLLKIYSEDNPDDVLLQCRFMLCEMAAPIEASVSSRTDIDYNEANQQVNFIVDLERAEVDDPFNDLLAVVGQNGRLDNEVAIGHPLRLQGRKAVFEHLPKLISRQETNIGVLKSCRSNIRAWVLIILIISIPAATICCMLIRPGPENRILTTRHSTDASLSAGLIRRTAMLMPIMA